ncbi:Flagellar hook-length control protein FliK [Comamonas testosteroni]|uniref:Flagellar hook-length control protein FliK n=1 Tax=Comamonas testosteroni TaxID=285 RepID=A0A8B4SCP6_COMTE|nr:Flagellar hook-length control protein FliK [Comamonas testosteroni]
MHKAQALPQQGISLQGMTAVQPQALEGLKDLLRAARSPQQDEAAPQGKTAAVQGGADLQAAAAAVGAAMGAASAGMQGGGQNSSDFGQSLAGQDAAPTEREQEVSEQVAFWVHQKTQNAALSIQHEGKAIQVQVQLNGQEAHVRFAAGDEQARQLLADGQAQLRELLQAQGLNLSGVSVDGGGAGARSGDDSQGEDARRGQARVARVSVNAAELPMGAARCAQWRAAGAVRCGPFRVNDQSRLTETVSRTGREPGMKPGFALLFGQWSAGRAANNSGVDLPCRGNGCEVDAVPHS